MTLRKWMVSLTAWVDSDAAARDLEPTTEFNWLRCLPFILCHLACLMVIWVGWSPVALWVALGLYLLRMFAITGFYHRYFSHRSFKTSRAFQFLFALIGCTAVQRGPLWWAAHHRHHHRHSDTEKDVHSPVVHGFIWSHFAWFTNNVNFPTAYTKIKDFARFPELRFLNRYDVVVPIGFAGGIAALGWLLGRYLPEWGTNGPQMLCWGFFISTVAVWHGTFLVNSLAHVLGRRRYDTRDDSRNNLAIALVTLGEGWHNNHHRYPASTRQGFFWWEIDLTYYLLKLFQGLGLVWDLKPVPAAVLAEGLSANR